MPSDLTWEETKRLIDSRLNAKLLESFDHAVDVATQGRSDTDAKQWGLVSIGAMLDAVLDKSQPTERRIAATVALGQRRHRSAVLPLIAAMHEEALANACAHALIAIGSRRHLRRLIQLLKPHTPDYLKQEAIYCLWMLNDRRGATSLAHIALDHACESEHTRLMATEALGNNVHKAFIQRVLAKTMIDPSVDVRMSALCAVGRLHDRPLLQVLRRAMESRLDDPEVIYDSTFGEQARETLDQFDESTGLRRLGRFC